MGGAFYSMLFNGSFMSDLDINQFLSRALGIVLTIGVCITSVIGLDSYVTINRIPVFLRSVFASGDS